MNPRILRAASRLRIRQGASPRITPEPFDADSRLDRTNRPPVALGPHVGSPIANAVEPALAGMILAFNKPYGVISQFTPDGSPHRTLTEFAFPPRVYAIGRLDADSEGLLLLSDEPEWNARLLHPRQGHPREYWAQVERIPSAEALRRLESGVRVAGRPTLPCRAWRLEPPPSIPPRDPPIRFRKNVPDCWIALELVEGRNRQVRRMTAAVGHPTLRLWRAGIGALRLDALGLNPGQWRELTAPERSRLGRGLF